MAFTDSFVEQAIAAAMGNKAQEGMVNFLTEDNPIVASIPVEATSDGLQDVYEVAVGADGVPLMDFDAPLNSVDSESALMQTNLKQWGAKIVVGEDKLKQLKRTMSQHTAKKMPLIMDKTGNTMGRTIYYNSLRAYAIANYDAAGTVDKGNPWGPTRVINAGGTTANKQFSIVAVKWKSEELTGLYSADGWGNGKVFDLDKISGGNRYEDPTTKIMSYGNTVKLNFGMKLANPQYVTSIVNIQDGADFEAIKLNEMIDKIIMDARNANAIYMHPALLQMLGSKFKFPNLFQTNENRDINSVIARWNGVPIIADYNLDYGTEAVVTL